MQLLAQHAHREPSLRPWLLVHGRHDRHVCRIWDKVSITVGAKCAERSMKTPMQARSSSRWMYVTVMLMLSVLFYFGVHTLTDAADIDGQAHSHVTATDMDHVTALWSPPSLELERESDLCGPPAHDDAGLTVQPYCHQAVATSSRLSLRQPVILTCLGVENPTIASFAMTVVHQQRPTAKRLATLSVHRC